MLLSLAIITCLIWLYLVAAHGSFWRVERFMPSSPSASDNELQVVAVVPARNEADVIAPAVTSLLQQHSARIHVVLIDDSSSDGTASVASRAAEAANRVHSLTVIQGLPLPQGWSGKLWAVQQGIEYAMGLNPKFILLTDADIVHSPDNIQGLVTRAERGNYDLVSLMVKLHCETLAERMLIPAFVFFFLMLYPPAWLADPRRKTAGAAGGCILIRPQALLKAGGIPAIRNEIIDDCALASRVKSSGGRLWLGLTAETCSIRPYSSFAAIEHMISRAAFRQLRHSVLLLLFALAGLAITYLAPPALLLSRHLLPALLGAMSWLLMSISFWPMVRLYRLNAPWALLLPAIALFYMGATLHSAFKFWRGKGGEWKGRVQDPVES